MAQAGGSIHRGTAPTLQIMLKSKYLSFINKICLTNGIHGCIHCAMNANEISPKTNPRMDRIKKVSANLRDFFHFSAVVTGISGVLQILSGLIYHQTLFGLIVFHLFPIVPNKFGFGLIGCITCFLTFAWAAGAWFAYKLFFLYARGDLFSAEIVRCIRRIGFVSILLGIGKCFPLAALMVSDHNWAVLPGLLLPSLSGIIPGFAIVVIAWIMDEGRKIQEEQELTV